MRSKKAVGAAAVVISAAIGAAIALAATGGGSTVLSAQPAAATSGVLNTASSVGTVLPVAAANSSGAPSTSADPARPQGPHTVGDCTEAVLTGDDKAKAEAAANKAVPNATIDRTETDCDGAKYEVHMTKSDGSHVTVKEDASFNVTGVENGMGAGGPGHGPRGAAPQQSQPTTTSQ